MSKYEAIYSWLLTCPAFSKLSFISAEMSADDNIIIPFGCSSKSSYTGNIDVSGFFNGDKVEEPLIYEEYQVQMFRYTYAEQDKENIATFDDVQSVIDWILEQDEISNLPIIPNVKGVDCLPFIPQIAGRDAETGIFKYFFTLRIYYKNTRKGRSLDD